MEEVMVWALPEDLSSHGGGDGLGQDVRQPGGLDRGELGVVEGD